MSERNSTLGSTTNKTLVTDVMSKLHAPELMTEKLEWGVVCTDTKKIKKKKVPNKGM